MQGEVRLTCAPLSGHPQESYAIPVEVNNVFGLSSKSEAIVRWAVTGASFLLALHWLIDFIGTRHRERKLHF